MSKALNRGNQASAVLTGEKIRLLANWVGWFAWPRCSCTSEPSTRLLNRPADLSLLATWPTRLREPMPRSNTHADAHPSMAAWWRLVGSRGRPAPSVRARATPALNRRWTRVPYSRHVPALSRAHALAQCRMAVRDRLALLLVPPLGTAGPRCGCYRRWLGCCRQRWHQRPFLICEIHIFLFRAPKMVNNISVSISAMSSTQWCTLFPHLGHFCSVKNNISCKISARNKTCGTC
jgi:hypothetical protein